VTLLMMQVLYKQIAWKTFF